MKIVSTIEARMTSSRLPGKPMLKVNNRSMLEHLVIRLKSINLIDEIVLATTTNSPDDLLVKEADKLGIKIHRGDENNVMKRVIEAGESVKADVIVEITGDCPIIDPKIIEESINIFKSNSYDYVSNALIRTYPDGMDTQVFLLSTLKNSYSMTNSEKDYEHVTLHIRNNPEIFTHYNMIAPSKIRRPELGLTLDEIKDYELIKKIIEHFGDKNILFNCFEVINFIENNPELLFINNTVKRKGNE